MTAFAYVAAALASVLYTILSWMTGHYPEAMAFGAIAITLTVAHLAVRSPLTATEEAEIADREQK